MPFLESSREGYLLIDHRASPGIPEKIVQRTAFAGVNLGEGKLFEASTLTCGHCKTVQLKNTWRTRERGKCFKCMHYICDPCALAYKINLVCRPWDQVVQDQVTGKTVVPLLARDVK